jgi:endonuclease/exonuclease/phosphatase family metal-dependent hydrolase
VVSWNVRSLRDDVDALVAAVRALGPDVLCLQEAPRFLRWRHALAELARRCGLPYTCGGATTGGPALLTSLRVQVDATFEWRLSRTPRHFQRGVAAARVRVGGASLLVASTHLGLSAPERERHAGEILELLAGRAGTAVVLAADLNETDAGGAWRTFLAAGLRDTYPVVPRGGGATFPARAPRRRIDAVFADATIGVAACGVPDIDPALLARATDHLPVLADLTLPPRQ